MCKNTVFPLQPLNQSSYRLSSNFYIFHKACPFRYLRNNFRSAGMLGINIPASLPVLFLSRKVSKKYMLPHASIAMMQNESIHKAELHHTFLPQDVIHTLLQRLLQVIL